MAHTIKIHSPVFRVEDEVGDKRVIISPGAGPTIIHIGECRDCVIHWLRQPTGGSIELTFQTGTQKAIKDDAFDTVQDGLITFTSTAANKKIVRDVWSSHMQIAIVDPINSAAEFVVEPITFMSRS